MTLATLLQPVAVVLLYLWCFAVLSAAQVTIRLIMAYSVRRTVVAALPLLAAALLVAVVFDATTGPEATLAARLRALPLAMLLMGMAGFGVARWVLNIKRLRGQIVAGTMVGLLDPHLFTLL